MVRPSSRVKGGSGSCRDLALLCAGVSLGIIIAVTFDAGGSTGSDTSCALTALSAEKAASKNAAPAAAVASASSDRNPHFVPAGMNPIYAYYGKLNHLSDEIPTEWWLETSPKHQANKKGSWFSQHGQDVAVAKFLNFKRDGFFVDLAANDAVWASNTFSLEQNFGWKGICIEANPVYWYRLSFRNCHVVGGIVGGQNNVEVEVNLGEAHEGPVGGIVGKDFDNKHGKRGKPPEKRYTVALGSIFEMWNAPKVIDYLSLDVEGAETYIMREFPFEKYQFKTMTVERPKDELKDLFTKHGYKHVLDFKRGDTLWAHESVYDQGKPLVDVDPQDIHKHTILSGQIPGFA